MKKVNIIDLDNVYRDIIKNVKNKRRIYEFEKYKLEYLTLCANIINEGNYKGGYYNIFIIYEPKLRVIMSQKLLDKIINHYITRTVLIPKLDKFLLDENTATRINKGHSYAINLFKEGIEYYKRRYKTFYFLKLDIKKYFYNIDHEVLKSLIKPYLDNEEYKILCSIIDSTDLPYINEKISILRNKYNEDLPYYKIGKGLPIGNMTSQFLAVFYLYKLHYFIKHNLHIKKFVVYMDDYILIHEDKDYLKYCKKVIEEKLNKEYKLKLNKNKSMITKSSNGINFLGHRFIIKDNKTIIKITNSTKRKIKTDIRKNLNKYNNKLINYQKLFSSITNYKYSYIFVNHKKINEISWWNCNEKIRNNKKFYKHYIIYILVKGKYRLYNVDKEISNNFKLDRVNVIKLNNLDIESIVEYRDNRYVNLYAKTMIIKIINKYKITKKLLSFSFQEVF